MLQEAESVMYAKLTDLNTKVGTLTPRLKLELGNEALLAGMGEEAVKALSELTRAMEHYSAAVNKRLGGAS